MKGRCILVFFFLTALLGAQVKDDDYVLSHPHDYKAHPARSANFIELLGNGSLYSLNFDQILLYKEKFKISGRAGIAVYPNNYRVEQAYVLENNYIFLPGSHHLELGPGVTMQRKYNPACGDTTGEVYKWENIWYGILRIGYRFQKQEDGFFFRFGLTPIFYRKDSCESEFPPANWFWLGISIGVSY